MTTCKLAAVEQATGGPEAAGAYLEAVTKRQILSRILTNLKASYVRRHDPARALQAVDYQLAMAPWALDEVRDRGLLLAELRRDHEALAALRQYRTHGPASVDMDAIDAVIAQIEHRPAEGEGS